MGNYELVRAIGSGGMGVVFEAHHEALGRQVAIKVLHALAADTPKSSVVRARFLREGRAAAQVRHPHVVDVFDFGVQDGTPFLVMELVQGESLAERLEREKVLSLSDALEIILPVLSAVGELHAAGIIHRDLKPANILLGRGRGGELCPKVADFGVSRVDDGEASLTDSGVVVGTYKYMAPEQARHSRTATERADQYALGVILYECLTGQAPFEGDSPYELTHAILHAPIVPPADRNPALPRPLDAIILRALSRDAEARFECVEELGAALLAFAETGLALRWRGEFLPSTGLAAAGTIPPFTSAPVPVTTTPRRRWRFALGVVPAVAVVASLVGAAVVRRERAAELHAAVASPPPSPSVASARLPVPETEETPAPAATSASTAIMASTAPPPQPPAASRKSRPEPRSRPQKLQAEDRPDLDNGAPLLDPR